MASGRRDGRDGAAGRCLRRADDRGGFGGSVIALVYADRAPSLRAAIASRFAREGWPAPRFIEAVPSAGARRIR